MDFSDLSLRNFLFGAFGSFAVEVVRLIAIHESGRDYPARYRRKSYRAIRGLLVVIGGVLAAAYKVQSDVLAISIDATAPAIINSFTHRPPGESGAGKSPHST